MPAACSWRDSVAHYGCLQFSEQTTLIPFHLPVCVTDRKRWKLCCLINCVTESSFEPLMVTSAVERRTWWSARLTHFTPENSSAICVWTLLTLHFTFKVITHWGNKRPHSGFCVCLSDWCSVTYRRNQWDSSFYFPCRPRLQRLSSCTTSFNSFKPELMNHESFFRCEM